jgi:hypothetical protein
MKNSVLVVALLSAALECRAEEIYQDFRGKDIDEALFRLQGADAAQRIKVEPQGLRITMPFNLKSTTVGIATRAATRGDFEITVGYEIIQAERPKGGSGVGLEMYLNTNTPTQEGLVFYRAARPKEGEVYACDKKATVDGERKTKRSIFPTDSKSGRLFLSRKGTEVTFSAAEGAGNPQELCRYEWGTWDLNISVRAWGSHNVVDLRLTDIRIRDQIGSVPVANAELAAPAPPPSGRRWLLGGLLGALLLSGGGLWAWRHMAARGSASTGNTIAFFCASCGKHLSTGAASAGKSIKCPGCGQSAPVPGTTSAGPAAGAR